jgi:hypothetical protein
LPALRKTVQSGSGRGRLAALELPMQVRRREVAGERLGCQLNADTHTLYGGGARKVRKAVG